MHVVQAAQSSLRYARRTADELTAFRFHPYISRIRDIAAALDLYGPDQCEYRPCVRLFGFFATDLNVTTDPAYVPNASRPRYHMLRYSRASWRFSAYCTHEPVKRESFARIRMTSSLECVGNRHMRGNSARLQPVALQIFGSQKH